MSKPRIHLLIIDPQNDFVDIPGAALPVNGAAGDMERLAKLVDRVAHNLDRVHVTLDSHRLVDIAHPVWWVNSRGENPAPFTLITANDIETGIWTTRNPRCRTRSLEYARALEDGGKYALFIWPPHCLIGTWGHNVYGALNDALQRWSEERFGLVNYVSKGSNPWTEHYGALMAEVPDPLDSATYINRKLLNTLSQADIIGVAGEASSHCVLTTVNQIVKNIGDEHLDKFHLITDCMSPVGAVPGGPDFPAIAESWLQDMQNRGLVLTGSEEFLA